MAPPTPGRHRGPRPQVNNNIGEAGRTTNVVPPKYVPRDSAGHERPEDFFDRAANSGVEDDEDDDMYDAEPAITVKQSVKKKIVVNGVREKRGERPDRFMLGDDRGRKTGVVKAMLQRDEEGFEDVNNFFQSPSPTRSTATAKSTVKSRKNGLFNPPSPSPEYEGDDYEEDESDMMVDDGTSLSPLTYQRLHPSSARQPSSLRHSTAASGHESTSRKGLATSSPNSPRKTAPGAGRRRLSSLSGSGDEGGGGDEEEEEERFDFEDESDDEEAEDEVVRATLGAGRYSSVANGSAKKLNKGKGKAVARTASDDEDDEQRISGHDFADGDEDDDAPGSRRKSKSSAKKKKEPAAPRASNVSSAASPSISSGLMKLDKNGRPVPVTDRKGKGKEVVRSPSPPLGVEGEEELEQYYDEDFGGGFGDDEDADGMEVDVNGFQQYDAEEFEQDGEEEEEDLDAPGPSSRPMKENKKKGSGGKAVKGGKKTSSSSRRESGSPVSKKASSSQARKRMLEHSQEPIIEEVPRKRQREGGTVDIDGVRRSTRQRLEPLEYWRNERVVYRRRHSGIGMNAIVRVPKEEPLPLTKAGKKTGSRKKGSAKPESRGRARSIKQEAPPEEGCDDMTDPDGIVFSWEGNAEVSRRIAFTAKMMDPKPVFDGKFSFQKIYNELDYLAGGIMVIPPGKAKGLKPSRDNSYIFYCIEGSVSVVVHRARFTIGPGGSFFVPRGNHYSITATSDRDVRLFFAQGRRVLEYENGDTQPDTIEDSQRRFREMQEQQQEQELDAVPEEDEEEEDE
ncbi:hypothetical protein JCM11251_001292 [Rhodosporidiobolus azoricus]